MAISRVKIRPCFGGRGRGVGHLTGMPVLPAGIVLGGAAEVSGDEVRLG